MGAELEPWEEPRPYAALVRSPFKRRGVRLTHHATLAAPDNHPELASVSVGPRGEAMALWTDLAGLAAIGADGEVLEPERPGTSKPPVSTIVTIQAPGRLDLIGIADLTTNFPMVQSLPGGRVLVVGARAEWRVEGPEENATIYGPDGAVLLTACVGDGIEHVRTTPSGAVWLGYFDEGVYGNLGWGEPGGPEPMGWCGLFRTTPELDIEWRYPANKLEPIDDCYALNLDGEVAWAYTYSSFSVARVENSQVRLWPTQVDGANALVVAGDWAALIGGYGPNRDRLVLGQLGDALTEVRRARVAMPDGRELPSGVSVK